MEHRLTVGDAAPDFSVSLGGGGQATLADFAGGWLVLYFYPRDDTPGCTQEAKDFTDLSSRLEAAGARVLGVSRDTVAKHEKFAVKHHLSVALGADVEGDMCEAYGVWVEKKLYGKVYMGIERTTFLIGPDGRIRHVWNRVKVKGHAEAVASMLEEMI